MKHSLFAASIVALAVAGIGNAQETRNSVEPALVQARQLMQGIHAPEQYNSLAAQYNQQQQVYLKKAEEEKAEWMRRSQNIQVVAAKYPRPVDSARYLYEYYSYKASEAGALSAQYRALARPNAAEAANLQR
ncbi:MAG: hypothetical protein ABSE87_06535 [Terracidiphilus sp.]|jgi:hypothetical protein